MRHLDRRQALALALGASVFSPLQAADAAAAANTAANAADAVRYPIGLALNENPWGPGPKARAAVAAAVDDGCRYGIEYSNRLMAAIAA
ncbi:MAG: hypothetical protein KJS95_12165, partial [Gammaproteobacteria bacterium]|nr:hypothetical protein [Gammaproteobacteria bacterium]